MGSHMNLKRSTAEVLALLDASIAELSIIRTRVAHAMEDTASETPQGVVIDNLVCKLVIDTVVWHFHTTRAKLMGKAQTRALVLPRHIAMYLVRQYTNLSFPDIGQRFSGRDHSTVQSAVKKIMRLRATDPHLKATITEIQDHINASPLYTKSVSTE